MGRGNSGRMAGGNSTITQMRQMSEKWYEGLTDDEKKAVSDAQLSTQNLNEYLSGRRKFDDEMARQLEKEAKTLDSALSKFKTDKEIVTYRGVSSKEFAKVLFGEAKTQGVKSTSYSKDQAASFAKNQGGYIIEYHVKKGNFGADVNGVARANEKEFLIRNGMKQKTIKQDGKKLIVEIG